MIKCSVCILTYNNEGTLEKCLGSVKDFSDIVILDGGSTDNTLEIAKAFGASIFPQSEGGGKIEDFTAVRERLFGKANEDWILWLDSDEWVSDEVKMDIKKAIEGDEKPLYSFIRKVVIGEKVIDYAYFYPEYCKRFWNKNSNVVLKRGKKVHEGLVAGDGVSIKKSKSVIYHSWWESYSELIKKDAHYLDLTVRGKENFSLGKKVRIAYINVLKAGKVFLKSFLIYLRYGFKKTLPISYSWRFVRYHLIYARKIIKI